jgi:Putative beta barrel porin-7 (BBP7)
MKRILYGLSCSLLIAPGVVLAQDAAPAARLGSPISPVVRAQSPEFATAAGLDITPKVMPKGRVSETGTPNPLPMPTSAAPVPGGPNVTIPPGGTVNSPVIIDPPGTPFPTGPIMGDPLGGCPVGEPCHTNSNSGWYTAVEGLLWWVKSYSVPALVTAGPAGSGAALGTSGTAVLFGANSVDTNPRYGARVTLGYWLNPCWAVELSAFYVRPTNDKFTASSAGYPNQDLARPFFSLNRNIESSEIIGRPGVVSGFVQVDSKSTFYGAELNLRHPWWNSCANRLDFIAGIRYLYLEEQLIISETSRGLGGAGALAGVERSLVDNFTTQNRFLGGQVGAIFEHTEGPWTFSVFGKVAAGVNRQTSEINGGITAIAGGAPPTRPGGLLALNSNIGIHRRDVFAVVPEVGINVGYDITPRLRIFGGYSFMYWSDVARPGRQIDRVLDENRIPDFPAAPAATGTRPLGQVNSESLWVQGVNFGILFKW